MVETLKAGAQKTKTVVKPNKKANKIKAAKKTKKAAKRAVKKK